MASPRSAALPPASASALPSTRGTPPSCSARSSSTMQLDAAIWTQNFAQRSRRFVYIWVSRHQHNTRRSAVHLRYGLPPLLPWCSAGPLFRPVRSSAPERDHLCRLHGQVGERSLLVRRGSTIPSSTWRYSSRSHSTAERRQSAFSTQLVPEFTAQVGLNPAARPGGGAVLDRPAVFFGLDYCTAHMRHATAAPQPLHVALVPSRPTRKR